MSALYYYRRHLKACKRRGLGRKELSCNCPLWVDGMLKDKRYNRALGTRNLKRAAAIIEEIQSPDHKEPKLVTDAIATFQTARQDVGEGTRRNYRRVLGNLVTVAKAHGIAVMSHISASTWTKEREILGVFFRFALARKWVEESCQRG